MKFKPSTILFFYFVLIIVVAALLPDRVDWSPKYGSTHKEPLGTFIFFELLPDLFDGDVQLADKSIYSTIKNETANETCYMIINDNYQPDALDISYLLKFIDEGGEAFISASTIGYQLTDTLGIHCQSGFHFPRPLDLQQDSVGLSLTHKNFNRDTTYINSILGGGYLYSVDSQFLDKYQILGRNDENEISYIEEQLGKGRVNFIKRKIGEGQLFIHLCPSVFTNYELLYQNTGDYVAACLSYIENENVIFDDYYKSGRVVETSPLSVIHRTAPLRTGWRIIVVSIILFMIFGFKRLARPIPILKPYKNESLQWINTIAAMHYGHRNNRIIAEKRFVSLKRFINRRYRVTTENWDKKQYDILYKRTGVKTELWKDLLSASDGLSVNQKWEAATLRRFSQLIDSIYTLIK